MTSRRNTGVKLGDEGREVAAISGILEQLDYAEKALLESGIGESAARKVLAKFPHITRKHANRLLVVIQRRWQREAGRTDRTARKALVRQRVEQLYRLALERKRPMLVSTAIGVQQIEYAHEPDLRAAGDALDKLIDLDALRGEIIDDLQKTPEGARQAALRAWAESYGAPALEAENEEKEPL